MPSPAEVFKCLADETRVRATLLIVDQGELCVCELMCALADSQPKISRHLAQLRSAGLLLDRRQGQWVYYRLNPAGLDPRSPASDPAGQRRLAASRRSACATWTAPAARLRLLRQ